MKKIVALIAAALLLAGCSERNLDQKPQGLDKEPVSSSQSDSGKTASKQEKQEPQETEENKSLKLAKSYAEILSSGKYYIDCTAVIEYEGMTLTNPMLIAVDGENSSISVSSDLSGAMQTIRTLTFDGAVYMINDEQRSYMQIDDAQVSNSFNTDFSDMKYIGEGNEKFDGSEHDFIEFDCGGDSVKLFFDNDRLIGMTRSIADGEISQTVLKISGISQNIPDRLVAMPLGYTKQ